ncbi:MAG: ketosteroid isomerase family protein [Cyanobacteria bacterium J06560_2]
MTGLAISVSQRTVSQKTASQKAASQKAARQVIERYFASFNQGDFEQTAALFAQTGELMPPFEGAIAGQANILNYLQKKAQDMMATPMQWSVHPIKSGPVEDAPENGPEKGSPWQINVTGKVKAIVFQVNVSWQFTVDGAGQIASAKIKLLASPKELLSLQT